MGEGRLVPGEGTGGPDGGGLVRTPAACLHIPADPGRLIANERAVALAVQLGQEGHELLADLRGDVLVLGCDERLDDVSVPAQVIDAARQSGIVVISTDENR